MKRLMVLTVGTFLSVLLLATANAATPNAGAGGSQGKKNHNLTQQTAPAEQNSLKDAGNQAAALRKSKGKMRSTTNDDRWAAAKRHSSRHAAAVAKREGGKK